MKFNKGDILSRTSYMIVKNEGSNIEVRNDKDLSWSISKHILTNESKSANYFEKEETISRTKICEILESTNGAVFTVNFNKQVDNKAVKETLEDLYPNKGKIMSKDDFDKQVKSILKDISTGEERTLIGYLLSTKQEFGRYAVTDLEIVFSQEPNESKPVYAIRQVDSKTINWLVFDKVKYIVK